MNDPDVLAHQEDVKVYHMAYMKENETKQKEMLKVDPEQMKQIEEEIAKSGETIDPKVNDFGLLAWAEYLKVFRIVITMQLRRQLEIQTEMKDARRVHVESGDKQ